MALARLDAVIIAATPPVGAASFPAGEATAALSIAAFIDVAAETSRLRKELTSVEADIERLNKKLDNQAFMDKAPEAVVKENQDKLEEAQASRAKLASALNRLLALG
jgi:valyl-tRNA synthetase